MFKVLLVDDETVVRLALKTMINWEENGLELIGEAKDGISALEIIDANTPDIIIADLKMPNMDGLSLIKELKKRGFAGKILVLSNYGDFELVRDAMKLGAVDYLLKVTMKAGDLIGVLKNIGVQLESERKRYEEDLKTKVELNSSKALLKNNFLKEVLEENTLYSRKEIEENFERYGIDIKNSCSALLYIYIDNVNVSLSGSKLNDKKLNAFCIENIIKEILDCKNGGEIIELTYRDFAAIVHVDSMSDVEETLKHIARDIAAMVKLYINLSVSIVIGDTIKDIGTMRHVFISCKSAISMKFYFGDGSIINMKDIAILNRDIDNTMCSNAIAETRQCIEFGEIDKVNAVFKRILDKAEYEKYCPDVLKKYMSIVLDDLQRLFLEAGQENINFIDECKGKLEQIETLVEYRKTITGVLGEINTRFNELKRKRNSKEVNFIIEFIKQNISSRMTLGMIAKSLNMSEGYLCKIFKNEQGMSIMNFINSVKMEKAKELLKEPSTMVKEVAYSVGIDDQFYFNRVFKKYIGISPTDYKKKYTGKTEN